MPSSPIKTDAMLYSRCDALFFSSAVCVFEFAIARHTPPTLMAVEAFSSDVLTYLLDFSFSYFVLPHPHAV